MTRAIASLLLLSGMCWGQSKLEYGLALGSATADLVATQRNQQRPNANHWESNPIARPFVSHGYALNAAFNYAPILSCYLLERSGHKKLARYSLWFTTADHGWGAVVSLRGHEK